MKLIIMTVRSYIQGKLDANRKKELKNVTAMVKNTRKRKNLQDSLNIRKRKDISSFGRLSKSFTMKITGSSKGLRKQQE